MAFLTSHESTLLAHFVVQSQEAQTRILMEAQANPQISGCLIHAYRINANMAAWLNQDAIETRELIELRAKVAQALKLDSMLDDAELCPNGDTFNSVLDVLRNGPYATVSLCTHMGDASFTLKD